jgi:hypothetical protein
MKDIKNYIIALLAGLLVLTISTQPSQGAGTSKEAKTVEYSECLKRYAAVANPPFKYLDEHILNCAKYKP